VPSLRSCIIAASHPPWVSHSAAVLSLRTSWEPALVAVAVQTAFRQDEERVQAAHARSAAESWAAGQAHCGWARSDCSAVLLENDSPRAVVPGAELWADGWVPACSTQADLVVVMEHGSVPAGPWADGVPTYSAQADLVVLMEHGSVLAGPWADGWVPACSAQADSVVLMEHGSDPADYSEPADPREQHCSLDAQPVHGPVAELPPDSPEGCKVSLFVLRAQRRGH